MNTSQVNMLRQFT